MPIKFLSYIPCVYFNSYLCLLLMFSSVINSFPFILHVLEHMCMQPLWQLSGFQAGGIRFEFGPEICTVFCLARYNLLVCKLAEKASFEILTWIPFTDIFFSIWWCVIIFCASEAAGKLSSVFTSMLKHTNQWTLLAFDIRNLHLFYGKNPEYKLRNTSFQGNLSVWCRL